MRSDHARLKPPMTFLSPDSSIQYLGICSSSNQSHLHGPRRTNSIRDIDSSADFEHVRQKPRTVFSLANDSYSLSDSIMKRDNPCPDGGVSGIVVSPCDRVAEEACDCSLPVPRPFAGNVAVSWMVVRQLGHSMQRLVFFCTTSGLALRFLVAETPTFVALNSARSGIVCLPLPCAARSAASGII